MKTIKRLKRDFHTKEKDDNDYLPQISVTSGLYKSDMCHGRQRTAMTGSVNPGLGASHRFEYSGTSMPILQPI